MLNYHVLLWELQICYGGRRETKSLLDCDQPNATDVSKGKSGIVSDNNIPEVLFLI
jgi:hypothetical protein